MVYYDDVCGFNLFERPLPIWSENTKEERDDALQVYMEDFVKKIQEYKKVKIWPEFGPDRSSFFAFFYFQAGNKVEPIKERKGQWVGPDPLHEPVEWVMRTDWKGKGKGKKSKK